MLHFHAVPKFFQPSENLVMNFVRTFSQVVALVKLLSYHSPAGPRSREETAASSWKCNLPVHQHLQVRLHEQSLPFVLLIG